MIKTLKKIPTELLAIATASVLLILVNAGIANANPSYFQRQNNGISETATTSINYMSFGAATSTYYFDAGQGTAGSVDSAVLLAQMTASSTSSVVNISYEYAQGGNADCIGTPTACDWYQNDMVVPTSTAPFSIGTQLVTAWTFSSTTQGGGIPGGNRQLKTILVPTPTRYVRAIVTVPSGSTNLGFWAEFVAKKQAAN